MKKKISARISQFLNVTAGVCLVIALANWVITRRSSSDGRRLLRMESLVNGTGAEDYDLFIARGDNARTMDSVLACLHVSPHFALWTFKGSLDEVVFGRDEADMKSPWSHPLAYLWWFLAPGFMFIYSYLRYFLDTNFYMTSMLMLAYAGADFSFIVDLIGLFRRPTRMIAIKGFGYRVLLSIVVSAFIYVLYGTLATIVNPRAFRLLVDFAFLVYVALGWRFTISLLAKRLRTVWVTFSIAKTANVTDRKLVESVIAAAKHAKSAVKRQSDWRTEYESRGGLSSAGAFGSVQFGTTRAPDGDEKQSKRVAIKTFFSGDAKPPSILRTVSDACLAALPVVHGYEPGQRERKVQEAFDAILLQLGLQKPRHVVDALHEIKALRAVGALNHPAMAKLLSAHIVESKGRSPEVTIVTEHAGLPLDVVAPHLTVLQRLALFKRLLEAVGKLHSAGIVHRDLSPDNVCVSAKDASQCVLIDVGIALVPGASEDRFADWGKPEYFSPEFRLLLTHEYADTQIRRIVWGGAQPSIDMWALGIMACDLLFFGKKDAAPCFYFEVMERLGASADNVQSLPDMTAVIAAWTAKDTIASITWLMSKQQLGLPAKAAEQLQALLVGMLMPDPTRRISAAQAAQHPLFETVGLATIPPGSRVPVPPQALQVVARQEWFQLRKAGRLAVVVDAAGASKLQTTRAAIMAPATKGAPVCSRSVKDAYDLHAISHKYVLGDGTLSLAGFISLVRDTGVFSSHVNTRLLFASILERAATTVEWPDAVLTILLMTRPQLTDEQLLRLAFSAHSCSHAQGMLREEFRIFLAFLGFPTSVQVQADDLFSYLAGDHAAVLTSKAFIDQVTREAILANFLLPYVGEEADQHARLGNIADGNTLAKVQPSHIHNRRPVQRASASNEHLSGSTL